MLFLFFIQLENTSVITISYISRSNEESLARGVVSEQKYYDDKKRSIISLEICCMSWLYEFLAVVSAALTPLLHEYGIPNLHMIDAIIMSIVIPLTHLLNDEDTKEIIFEENWYQGIKYLFGLRMKKVSENNDQE